MHRSHWPLATATVAEAAEGASEIGVACSGHEDERAIKEDLDVLICDRAEAGAAVLVRRNCMQGSRHPTCS
ncbi:hypothetical protein CBOM_07920 [Ceraceosorus bombacis]|uniref:Uncharacterized protein n=1 Tax=Ceraceosorus bombacis TaxID=401625 RepID=A0A0P1BQE5_9BASI|nr:hypothetical protein CBOM_07920 [Ceraceosorus bombacis]